MEGKCWSYVFVCSEGLQRLEGHKHVLEGVLVEFVDVLVARLWCPCMCMWKLTSIVHNCLIYTFEYILKPFS